LEPPPAGRLRRAYLHLPRSTASRSSAYHQPPSAFVTHHYAYLPAPFLLSHLCPFALRPALPASLAGRYPRDYYGHSVAIGLAPGRRSHVRQRRTWQRDLGVPFASLHALTGHRSCAPEECPKPTLSLRQGPAPVTGVFPAGDRLPLPEAGIQAIQLSPCRADPPARHPIRLGTATGFLACCCPLHLSDPGQPSDPETTPLIPAR
jgi:hypothetical protein